METPTTEQAERPRVEVVVFHSPGCDGLFWCYARQIPLHDTRGWRELLRASLPGPDPACEVPGFDAWWADVRARLGV